MNNTINPLLLAAVMGGSLAAGIYFYQSMSGTENSLLNPSQGQSQTQVQQNQVQHNLANRTELLDLSEYTLHYQKPRKISDFALASHIGEAFSKTELKGKWSLAFLGYTSCPDICPTTLQELNFAYPELKAAADKTQILFITADPQRDSTERLSLYIRYFNEEFVALRGEHDKLFPFTRELGLMYSFNESSHDSYEVSHSGAIVLINPQATIEAIFKPQHLPGEVPTINPEYLVQDFQKIVKSASLLAKN